MTLKIYQKYYIKNYFKDSIHNFVQSGVKKTTPWDWTKD